MGEMKTVLLVAVMGYVLYTILSKNRGQRRSQIQAPVPTVDYGTQGTAPDAGLAQMQTQGPVSAVA